MALADYLSRQTYVDLADPMFLVLLKDMSIEARLVEVSEPRTGRAGERFSLIFETEPLDGAESGLFDLEHPEIGTFQLFLVPLGRTKEGGFELEAVFSPGP